MNTTKSKSLTNRIFIPVLMCCLLFVTSAFTARAESSEIEQSGSLKVSGIVRDETGEGIIGVNVSEKGTTNGTITDMDGRFTLQVKGGSILIFSYVGYTTLTMPASGTMNVVMKEDTQGLDEIVVVGYGVQKKVNLSGSVDALKGENLAAKTTLQTSQALQGMASGVTVTTNSGKPGSEGSTIRIRGIGTMNDNNPLVLIDGVASSIDAIDPNDIENMSILKDAASAAIYGSRAANGVILITTKRGKTEKVTVNYKGTIGITTPITLPKNASAWDYMTLYDEANSNDLRKDDGTPGGVIYGPEKIATWKSATDRDAYPNSDMFRETFKPISVQTQHYVGVSMGTEKFRTNTSINYSYQDAHYANTHYNRYGIRSNNSYTVSKTVEAGADINIRQTKSQDALGDFVADNDNGITGLMRQPALYATRYSNGVWGANYAGTPHPMRTIEEGLAMQYDNWQEIIAKLYLTVKPLEGLRLDFSYAPKINHFDRKSFDTQMPMYDYKTGNVSWTPTSVNKMRERRDKTREDDLNALINYTKTFNKKHDLNVLGGFQYLTNRYNQLQAYRQDNPFPNFGEINAYNPSGQTNSGYSTEWALMSYFGRVNYAFDSRYLLEANVRYDGSSRFANGYKWGLFPSFSAAWRFQAEEFMKKHDWLTNGKIRVSWGELGNQAGLGSEYPFSLNIATNQYTVFGGKVQPGYAALNYAMRNITWESTRMFDVGLDLGFFHNKLDVTFDWYMKDTKNILLSMAIPGVMGYANSPKQNAGAVRNTGFDLQIGHNNTVGDFYYKLTGILSYVKNEITDLGGLAPQVSGRHVKMLGEPIDAIYGYVADGLFGSFQEARAHQVAQWGKLQGGDIRYKELAVDGKMTGDDRKVLGNVIPNWNYSLDMYGSWKGFDLNLFFQGVGKRDSYNDGWLSYPFQNASTALVQHMDRWHEGNPNPNATFPRLSINQQTNNLQTSSYWLVNAAYLRLKNVQIGWRMPKALFEGKAISGVRFFANGNNVFTIHSMPLGMDPEAQETAQKNYPMISSYTFGVELNF